MATRADYKVLRDDPFDLIAGEERELAFDLPDDLSDNMLVVAYKARPTTAPPFQPVTTIDVSLRLQQHLDTVTIRGDTVHGLWETFPRAAVNTDITNRLVFGVTVGTARISDVILWFRRDA
jgi:hypothetical protein